MPFSMILLYIISPDICKYFLIFFLKGPKIMKHTVLLTTDLYHPHNDPNDHWNLATL